MLSEERIDEIEAMAGKDNMSQEWRIALIDLLCERDDMLKLMKVRVLGVIEATVPIPEKK